MSENFLTPWNSQFSQPREIICVHSSRASNTVDSTLILHIILLMNYRGEISELIVLFILFYEFLLNTCLYRAVIRKMV